MKFSKQYNDFVATMANAFIQDAAIAGRYLEPVYKATGIDFLVRKSERSLGELEHEERLGIETGYVFCGTLLLAGVVESQPLLAALGGMGTALTVVKHTAGKDGGEG